MKAIMVFMIKAGFIAVWMVTCFYICRKPEGFDKVMYWILCGFPFGVTKMSMILIPKNYGIAGSVGVLAFNAVIGGILGGFILAAKIVKLPVELVTGLSS